MAQQFNDPQCRRADDPAHRCTDKHGDWFASAVRAARPGSLCWWERLKRAEDQRLRDANALRRLTDALTLEDLEAHERPFSFDESEFLRWLDSFDDIDWRESPEVR